MSDSALMAASTPASAFVSATTNLAQLDPKSNEICKILSELFETDKIPNEFYEAVIKMIRSFILNDRSNWVIEWLDIWKGAVRDCEKRMESEFTELKQFIRTRILRQI